MICYCCVQINTTWYSLTWFTNGITESTAQVAEFTILKGQYMYVVITEMINGTYSTSIGLHMGKKRSATRPL